MQIEILWNAVLETPVTLIIIWQLVMKEPRKLIVFLMKLEFHHINFVSNDVSKMHDFYTKVLRLKIYQ